MYVYISNAQHKPNVGGAVRRFDLPPIAVCQSLMQYLILSHRGQVESSHRPSHIFYSINFKPC